MTIMSGIAKGTPMIMPSVYNQDQLMSYDRFFIEINITRIISKSSQSYRFGQIFKRNEDVSKIFCNETVDHYYVDKIVLIDLMKTYDINY